MYLTVILPDTQKLARPLDRKTAVISLTKTLANSEAFANRYKKGWAFTCEALLKLLELPPLPTAKDDIIAENDVDDMAFGVGFTQLNTVKPRQRDPWPEIDTDFGSGLESISERPIRNLVAGLLDLCESVYQPRRRPFLAVT